MQRHTKIYLEYLGYGEQDFIPCEVCGRKATEIHHIKYKSRGGKDEIRNMMAICRRCHDDAHNEYMSEAEMYLAHWYFMDKKGIRI